jgi:hypothetical protein
LRILAYRLQDAALGGLDRETMRIVREPKGQRLESADARPFETRIPTTRDGASLRAGALLVREWNGKLERVMVLEKGFAWNGGTYGSLSQIAKAMTGTSWNGHRFFGLRTGKSSLSAPPGRRGRACRDAPLGKHGTVRRGAGSLSAVQAAASETALVCTTARESGKAPSP